MGWVKEDTLLVKDFKFKDFKEALKFVNEVSRIAQKLGHHPNILIHDYNKVRITTTTHSENRVTEKDKKLAKEIDKLKI